MDKDYLKELIYLLRQGERKLLWNYQEVVWELIKAELSNHPTFKHWS